MLPALAVTVVIGMIPFFSSCGELYDDVLRVHIKANSDSAADQSLKLAVRDRVVSECAACYDGCETKEDALRITREHLGEIEAIARDEIRASGFDYAVTAQVGEAYFHTRAYEDFTMPAGWYDALRLTIGDGSGENWWCVMYPALCVGAACRDEMREKLDEGEYRVVTADKVDFRFRAVEIFEDFLNLFK
jgi:stage II sporulation protein R